VGDPDDLEPDGLEVLGTFDWGERERPPIPIALIDDPLEPGMVAKPYWHLDHKSAFSVNAPKNGLSDREFFRLHGVQFLITSLLHEYRPGSLPHAGSSL
jgi:hypothetical protein